MHADCQKGIFQEGFRELSDNDEGGNQLTKRQYMHAATTTTSKAIKVKILGNVEGEVKLNCFLNTISIVLTAKVLMGWYLVLICRSYTYYLLAWERVFVSASFQRHLFNLPFRNTIKK